MSFLDADALNRTALEADHRLRRDLDARTQVPGPGFGNF